MARKPKAGLDYFPLNVDIDQDEKVALVEAQHGALGFAVIVKLFMRIYKNSYFYEWGEKEQLLFSKMINVDINSINVIINDCLKWELFDKELFEKYGILTSKGIQERYLEAVSRRKGVKIVQEYCLLPQNIINVHKNLIYVDINGDSVSINDDIGTQKKRKEKKVKEKKVLTTIKDEVNENNPYTFYEQHIGMLSPIISEQIKDWEETFSPEIVIKAIERAVLQNKRNWNYIQAILKNWHADNVKNINDVERLEREFNEKKKQYKVIDGGNRNEKHKTSFESDSSKYDFSKRRGL